MQRLKQEAKALIHRICALILEEGAQFLGGLKLAFMMLRNSTLQKAKLWGEPSPPWLSILSQKVRVIEEKIIQWPIPPTRASEYHRRWMLFDESDEVLIVLKLVIERSAGRRRTRWTRRSR